MLAVYQNFSKFVSLLPFHSTNFSIFFSDFFVASRFSQKCNFKSWKCLCIFFFAVDISFCCITVWYDIWNNFDSFVLIFRIIFLILWTFQIFIFRYMKHIYICNTYYIYISFSFSVTPNMSKSRLHTLFNFMSQWVQLIAACMCMSYLSTVISWKKTKYYFSRL